jgi:alpha-1,3-glucosyltransferase
MLIGLLYTSIALMSAGLPVTSCVMFAMLLLSKHLFIVMAPIFAAYIISKHLLHASNRIVGVEIVLLCVAGPLAVAAAAFAPFFVTSGTMSDFVRQFCRRLFPFERGLVHSYWAPNAWAAYLTIDKALGHVARRLGWVAVGSANASVLPEITPFISAVIVLLLIAVICFAILRRASSNFLICVVAAYLVAFMFGWHTHEKAILYALMPLWTSWRGQARIGWPLWTSTVAAVLCIFPLIFHPREQLILLSCATGFLFFIIAASNLRVPGHVHAIGASVMAVLGVLYYLHPVLIPSLPFAHLLMTSLACLAGLLPLVYKVFVLALWSEQEE